MTSQALAAPDDNASDDAAVPQQPTHEVDDRTSAVNASSEPGTAAVAVAAPGQTADTADTAVEIGGREGPDPTRYGDWEMRGRCIDF